MNADECHQQGKNKEVRDFEEVTELGIKVLSKPGKTALEKSKAYNKRLSIIREACLAVIGAKVQTSESIVHCLDVPAGTGITGLQWKKHLQHSVHVTIAEKETFEEVNYNCVRNDLSPRLLPLDFTRTPGDPLEGQDDKSLHVCKCSPSVILHMESFDFIYLNPHGDLVSLVDAAMCNLPNNGILCLVSTDSSHQFARSTASIKRQYGATALKIEYLKELACRIILGSVARAATKCNKGIQILFTMSVDDMFMFVIKVLRGPKFAEQSVGKIQSLLHCQICEERVFMPISIAPLEEPYKLLPCECQQNTPGKTGAVLGPMWSGDLFQPNFLELTLHQAKTLQLSNRIQKIFTAMLYETGAVIEDNVVKSNCKNFTRQEVDKPPACNHSNKSDSTLYPLTDQISDNNNQQEDCDNLNRQNASKRKTESEPRGVPPSKRQKISELRISEQSPFTPAFYYNVHHLRLKEINLPKFDKILELMREEGYMAMRTHFDPHGMRTNALSRDIRNVLLKHCCPT